MSRDLNKVMLIGRLGKDPEGNILPSGDQVANFSIATGEKWKDKESGEQKERTEWHRISVWGGLAKVCMTYLKKGSQVYIEGQLRTRKWTDKQGIERFSTEVICSDMQMLGGKSEGGGSASKPPQANERPAGAPTRQRDDFDDDIPF